MSDGNNFQGNGTPRDRHAIGDVRLHLTAEPQQGGTKSPRLSIYYHKNKVSIEVRTNVQSDMDGQERGIIRAEIDPHMFFLFLSVLRKTIDGPNGERPERIRIKRPDFQKRNNGEPVLESTIAVGKDADGVVYISVLSWKKDRPAIRFPFAIDKFIELVKADGSPWGKAEASVELARGYCNLWEQLIPQYMFNRYKQEEFKPRDGGGGYNRGGGGGGGGYNRGGGNYGGGQSNQGGGQGGGGDMRTEAKPAASDWNDDDLPF